MSDIKFYMAEVNQADEIRVNTCKDLETDFVGLKYSKCTGIDDYGKPKNIYTETYADADSLRVHIPKKVVYDATNVKFTFYFIGQERQSVYHNFIEYISGKRMVFWDNVRCRRLHFVFNEKVSITDEMFYGSEPYMKAEITVQNIYGKTEYDKQGIK